MKKLLLSLIFCVSCSAFSQVPLNDLCENAIEIFCFETIIGTNINATNDGPQAPDCQGVTTESGVWYKLNVDSNDIVITTCSDDTDFDTKISVYIGVCSNLVCELSNDDGCLVGGTASRVHFLFFPSNLPLYILVHGSNGEEGQFALSISSCGLVGVDDNSLLDFSVYPSPTTDILTIQSNATITQIELYNQLGQLVISNSNKNTIDISSVNNGIYFIKIKDENGNIGTKKVVKK